MTKQHNNKASLAKISTLRSALQFELLLYWNAHLAADWEVVGGTTNPAADPSCVVSLTKTKNDGECKSCSRLEILLTRWWYRTSYCGRRAGIWCIFGTWCKTTTRTSTGTSCWRLALTWAFDGCCRCILAILFVTCRNGIERIQCVQQATASTCSTCSTVASGARRL